MNTNNQSSVSFGGGGLLWVALIVLKALGKIGMSWFWVISSIVWAPIAIALVWLILILIFAAFIQ